MVDVCQPGRYLPATRTGARRLTIDSQRSFMHLTFVILVLSIALSGCRTTRERAHYDDVQAIADGKLGRENIIELNSTETLALCQQKPGADHARKQYRFIVIRLKDNTVVHEGRYSMGYVKWLDDDSIEVLSRSSPSDEDSAKQIIHVNSPVE